MENSDHKNNSVDGTAVQEQGNTAGYQSPHIEPEAPTATVDGITPSLSDEVKTEDPGVMVSKVFQMIMQAKADKTVKSEEEFFEVVHWAAQNLMERGIPYQAANEMFVAANLASSNMLKVKDLTKTVKAAYGYETESLLKLIEHMNQIHAVISIGGKCRVMKETVDPDTGLSDFVFSSPSDFKAFYSNRKVEPGSNSDLTLGGLWFNSRWRREYEGITFNPKETPEGYFNLWTGFAVEPKEGDCSKFLAHVKENIASGNKVIFDYIVAWMADGVQNPAKLPGVALVLRGSMGTGKGVFANGYGSLLGRHFMPLAQGSQLTGRFNDHMKDKVLLFADEAFWAGDKAAEGVLKALITEPSLIIEGKGENAFRIRNHLHFIFATNNDWCVPAGAQERRFFVVDVSEKHMQDHHYFAAIQHEMDNGGREALLHYLLHFDLGSFNLRKFPQTAALMEQKVFSMTPIQKFWFSKLESGILANGCTGWDSDIPTKTLYGDFVRFCNDMGIRHKPSDSEFGTQLKKIVPRVSTGKGRSSKYGSHRPNVYRLPGLQECREAFQKFINYRVEWPVYEEVPVVTPTIVEEPEAEAADQI